MRLTFAVVAAVFATACDDMKPVGCGGDCLASYFRIAIAPGSLSVAQGGSATAAVTIDRENFSGSVTLSATAVPRGVTIEFSQDQTMLTVSATAEAPNETTHVTITGVSGSESESTTLVLTIGTPAAAITVNGTYYTVLGTPDHPTPVKVWSAGASTPVSSTTNADGTFIIPDVTPPYDILFSPNGGQLLVLGLTRADPTLIAVSNGNAIDSGARVHVSVSGAHYPEAGGYSTTVDADCPMASDTTTANSDGTCTLALFGQVGASDTCEVAALQAYYAAVDAAPATYSFGATTGIPGAVNVSVTALTTHTIDVTATADGPVTSIKLEQFWVPGSHGSQPIFSVDSPAAAVTLTVPDDTANVPMIAFVTTLHGEHFGRMARALGAGPSLTVTAPAELTITSPLADATGVTLDTPFTTDGAGGVTVINVGTSGFGVDVVTDATPVTLGTLVQHGLTPHSSPSAQTFSATYYDNVATVDAFATGVGSLRWQYRDGSSVRSSVQSYTRAP